MSELQNACWGCAGAQLQPSATSSTRQSTSSARVTKQLVTVQDIFKNKLFYANNWRENARQEAVQSFRKSSDSIEHLSETYSGWEGVHSCLNQRRFSKVCFPLASGAVFIPAGWKLTPPPPWSPVSEVSGTHQQHPVWPHPITLRHQAVCHHWGDTRNLDFVTISHTRISFDHFLTGSPQPLPLTLHLTLKGVPQEDVLSIFTAEIFDLYLAPKETSAGSPQSTHHGFVEISNVEPC